MTDQLLLTEAEAAERLRICTRTLRKARQDGQLHYVLIGRAVRYTIEDLDSFVASNRKVNPPCPTPAHSPASGSSRSRRSSGKIIPFTWRNADC